MKPETLIRTGLAVTAAAGLIACSESGDQYYKPIAKADYPAADGPGESLGAGEIGEASRIAAIIEAHLRRLYKTDPPIRRDAHPKAHGCVEASVAIRSDLPDALRHGIFATPATYRATVRFSNGNENVHRPDIEPDGRGMAIKLYDPPGQPLTVDPRGAASQDFIMINYPSFLVGADPEDYRKLIGYVDADNKVTSLLTPVLTIFSIGWKGTMNAAAATSSKIDNPLNTRYWSMVPYQLGSGASAQAVKYSAAPCEAKPVVIPDNPGPDYLRQALAASLAPGGQSACMKLMVQPRTSDAMSVEDSRYEWPEDKAPFTEVATITFEGQTFTSDEQMKACEAMSYSPWHALPEDKPLGNVNRMREAIYQRISAVRRESEAETWGNK